MLKMTPVTEVFKSPQWEDSYEGRKTVSDRKKAANEPDININVIVMFLLHTTELEVQISKVYLK